MVATIKAWMALRNLSLKEAAKVIGISQSNLGSVLNGKTPSIFTARIIARAVHLEPLDVFLRFGILTENDARLLETYRRAKQVKGIDLNAVFEVLLLTAEEEEKSSGRSD